MLRCRDERRTVVKAIECIPYQSGQGGDICGNEAEVAELEKRREQPEGRVQATGTS